VTKIGALFRNRRESLPGGSRKNFQSHFPARLKAQGSRPCEPARPLVGRAPVFERFEKELQPSSLHRCMKTDDCFLHSEANRSRQRDLRRKLIQGCRKQGCFCQSLQGRIYGVPDINFRCKSRSSTLLPVFRFSSPSSYGPRRPVFTQCCKVVPVRPRGSCVNIETTSCQLGTLRIDAHAQKRPEVRLTPCHNNSCP